jgi:ring-1,2-phenylacetyl-CoA epoxidase subunit PaaC
MKEQLIRYLLMLGDNSMMLGHRLSELCGHGPNLETDIALTNISLDLFGEVRSYFQYAAQLRGDGQTEDSIAFLRIERDYYNVLLTEQENKNFAYVIVRQFLFDCYHKLLLEQLMESKDDTIAAIATKSIKESKYHLRFSSEWVKRLGDGTDESHEKMQEAVDYLYPYVFEFFNETDTEKAMRENKIGADLSLLQTQYHNFVNDILEQATLKKPDTPPRIADGKNGFHTEKLGYILSNLQYMQRAYPNMEW